jgi:3-hydroxyisobutyrate dehydrogenase-like beta-hydroxyacid dehydrogenase
MFKVGFIGLGLMGGPMALNVARAGYPLTVYNRTTEKAAPHRKAGASVAATPAALAETSDVIITMLSDANAVLAVLEGEAGILAGVKPGTTLIDMSTVAPEDSRMLARLLNESGVGMLDAPVYGSTGPAKEGTLGIMVGGEEKTFSRYRELLGTMGKNIFYMGPQGSGALVKLGFNLIVAAQVAALAEAMTLTTKGGLEQDLVSQVITSSGINSGLIERKARNITSDQYPPAFPLKHMLKDLHLMVRTAEELDVPLPATSVTHQLFTAARERELGELDFSAIYKLLAEMANVAEAT